MSSLSKRKNPTKLLFPAPLAPIRTFKERSSKSSSFRMDLKPSIVNFWMVSLMEHRTPIPYTIAWIGLSLLAAKIESAAGFLDPSVAEGLAELEGGGEALAGEL